LLIGCSFPDRFSIAFYTTAAEAKVTDLSESC